MLTFRSTGDNFHDENSVLYSVVLPVAQSAAWIPMSSNRTGQFHTQLPTIYVMVIMRLKLPGKEKAT